MLWINQFAVLPRDGGGTRHFELGRELVRLGWDVTIVAADYHPQRRTYTRRSGAADRRVIEEVVDGVQFRWLWAAPYVGNDWRRALNWLSFRSSVRKASWADMRPDIVIGSSPQLFAAAAGEALARRFRVPFVFEVRDLWPESLLAAGGRKGLGYFVIDRVANRLYRRAVRIIALAAGTRRYLASRGIDESRIVLVPNGVDVHLVRRESNGDARMPGPLTLVYAGAHGPANGLDVVLGAAKALRDDAIPVRFILIGDGPSKGELERVARADGLLSVEFREPVPKNELVTLLTSADAGLMLLRDAELFSFAVSPNKLFDYLSAGTPVVCNVRGEVADMIADSNGGIQARDASAAALADAIRTLHATAPAVRQAMGKAGRSWVERHHSREVLGARLDQALRAVLAEAK